MIKNIIKLFGLFTILLLFLGVYLSYFGIETERFNRLIKDQISEKNKNIDVKLNKVKILLNLKSFSFNIKTIKPKILYKNDEIKLQEVTTNFSLKRFLNKNLSIDDLNILTEEVNLKDVFKILKNYNPSVQLFILENMIKDGSAIADIFLNFDEEGKIKKDYKINVSIKNGSLRILSKKNIKGINFDIQIEDNDYLLSNLDLIFEELKFYSKLIKIKRLSKNFLINGDIRNDKNDVKPEFLNLFLKGNYNDLENFNVSSENKFSFKVNKKFKVTNLKLKSDIELDLMKFNFALPKLREFLPNFDNLIELKKHKINLGIDQNKLIINGKGDILIGKNNEYLEYNIKKKDNNYLIKSQIQIQNSPILIKSINYEKKENVNSEISFEGMANSEKKIFFNNISFNENKNYFQIKDLDLNKNFKINSFKEINFDFYNNNKIQNNIKLKKNKKNYELSGKIFDASLMINNLMNSKNNNKGLSTIFSNFNSNIEIKIDKMFLDKVSFINNLSGDINFINNQINELKLASNFSNKKNITLSIKTNKNNERVTTLFSSHPKPLINRYKFIKGFEEGILDFQSIKKGDISKSVLNIDNFKVKEVPVLAKLLTLASLQGIADLLTGEGIRFTDFEMFFSNKGNLMTIDEIYAIGPAISIMMSGYVESEKLISLRGTLVPARTINRTIASIPFIGNILVGKKAGEGVFGVSFKIKGPPKDLKTSVNPIKTLTPRFITRTLEKIKKN